MVEKHRAARKFLYLMFADVEKAYDHSPMPKLWDAMRNDGVSVGHIGIV